MAAITANPATEVPLQRVLVTPILVGANVLVWVAMVAQGVSPIDPDTSVLIAWGADFGPLTLAAEPWRLLTSMFLHAGLLHLALNSWALRTLGRVCERLLGSSTFLLLYLLSGLGADFVSLLVNPLTVSVGASGAIFGAAGALVALQYLRKLPASTLVLRRDLAGIGTFVLYNLMYGFTHAGIDNAAHMGGLVTGFGLGAIVPLPEAQGEPSPRGRLVSVFAVAGALLALAGAGVWRWRAPVAQFGAAVRLLDVGQTDSAIAALRRVMTRWPDEARVHYFLGVAYLRGHQPDSAIGPLTRAVELEPGWPDPRFSLGIAYLRTNRPAEALPSLDTALARAADSARVYLMRAIAYALLDRAADARTDLERAATQGARTRGDSDVVAEARRQLAALDSVTVRPTSRVPVRPKPSR